MMLLNFCIHAFGVLVIVHGLGTLNYLEILGGALIFTLAFFLRKHYFFYILVAFLLILSSIFYGYMFMRGNSFFPAMISVVAFFLILGVVFEVLNIYLKK